MSIKWLAIGKERLSDVTYYRIGDSRWQSTFHIREELLPDILWIPHKKYKDQALLLLSLGLTKEEIEQTLKESE